MRPLVLLIILIACATGSSAQLAMQQYYSEFGTATMHLDTLSSGNLFTGIANGSGVSILDPEGNIIHTQCYDGHPLTRLQSVRRHTDNEIYFVAGYLSDSCAVAESLEVDPVFGKMDSLGNILGLHRYQLNAVTCLNAARELEITSDGGAVAWGREESFFALKVDENSMPVWSKQFAHHGSFGFIRELPGGDLLAGINMDTAGVVVARLNGAGDFLWCKSYIRPRGNVRDCVIESDDSFIITGYTDSIASTDAFIPLPADYQPKLFLMKLDGGGDVQWCKGYEGSPRWYARQGLRMIKTLDGQYVVLANIGLPNNNIEYRPFLMKTDQNGDTLWTRSVGANGYRYLTIDLMASSDGGVYYDGLAYGDFGFPLTSAGYLFKTDALGHLACDEQLHPVEVTDLFPSDSSFVLSSVDGAEAFPISNAFTDYGPFTIVDSCPLQVGMPPPTIQSRKVQVRPNPSAGRFTVHFEDPLSVDSFYSVYDNVGRLLYQRPLAPGKENEEIDLSRFGKGTYLLRLTSREGVCNERVVVQ